MTPCCIRLCGQPTLPQACRSGCGAESTRSFLTKEARRPPGLPVVSRLTRGRKALKTYGACVIPVQPTGVTQQAGAAPRQAAAEPEGDRRRTPSPRSTARGNRPTRFVLVRSRHAVRPARVAASRVGLSTSCPTVAPTCMRWNAVAERLEPSSRASLRQKLRVSGNAAARDDVGAKPNPVRFVSGRPGA
jgi:hypothetical protein